METHSHAYNHSYLSLSDHVIIVTRISHSIFAKMSKPPPRLNKELQFIKYLHHLIRTDYNNGCFVFSEKI